jgi:hypothetical protein
LRCVGGANTANDAIADRLASIIDLNDLWGDGEDWSAGGDDSIELNLDKSGIVNQAHADSANRGDLPRHFQTRRKHGRKVTLGWLNQNRSDRRTRLGTVRSDWVNQSNPERLSSGNCLAIGESLGGAAQRKQQGKKGGASRAEVSPKQSSADRKRLSTSITHQVPHPSRHILLYYFLAEPEKLGYSSKWMFVKRTVGRSFKECPTGANYQTKEIWTTSRAAQPDSSDHQIRIQEIV